MRIRKHAKISPLLYYASSSSLIQTHLCQLNQSPWDVLTFPPPHPSPPFLVDEDRSYLANGLSSDHISADESLGEGFDNGGTKFEQGEEEPLSLEKNEEEVEEDKIFCSKIDGKRWECKKKVKNGQSFCDYHSAQPWVKKSAESRRSSSSSSRGARPKYPASSSNPYEYYYYSGFGPRWGKKRGAASAAAAAAAASPIPTPPAMKEERCTSHDTNHSTSIIEADANDGLNPRTKSSLSIDEQVFDDDDDYEDEEYDDDDDDENGEIMGRKRGRKPIKARSLKSLM